MDPCLSTTTDSLACPQESPVLLSCPFCPLSATAPHTKQGGFLHKMRGKGLQATGATYNFTRVHMPYHWQLPSSQSPEYDSDLLIRSGLHVSQLRLTRVPMEFSPSTPLQSTLLSCVAAALALGEGCCPWPLHPLAPLPDCCLKGRLYRDVGGPAHKRVTV